jgi:hypothetical protein
VIDEEVLWNVTRIGAATTGCQNQALGDKLGRSEIFRTKSPRNSIGKGVCFLTKKANLIKLLLSVAYRFSLLKSRPSFTEVIPNLYRCLGDQQFWPFALSIYGIRL